MLPPYKAMKMDMKMSIIISKWATRAIAMMRLLIDIPRVPTIKIGLLPNLSVMNSTEKRSAAN